MVVVIDYIFLTNAMGHISYLLIKLCLLLWSFPFIPFPWFTLLVMRGTAGYIQETVAIC